jgi:hypothetical protein
MTLRLTLAGLVLTLTLTAPDTSVIVAGPATRASTRLVAFAAGGETEPVPLPLQEALEKARVDGKYEMLLRQFRVAGDRAEYGPFRDLGPRGVKEYAGLTDLPEGHWVYVYPYWYVWRDLSAAPRPRRPYGPEQATGPPDTPNAGDQGTAWASLTPDGQEEWLLLEYAEPVVPTAVLIHETFCPGALHRVSVFNLAGEEVDVWKGKDPTAAGTPMGVSEIPFKVRFKTNRVKIYLDSKNVLGFNEIDAVGLRDSAGKTHWAASADASSSYAQPQGGVNRVRAFQPAAAPFAVAPAAENKDDRIRQLENEVKELKETLKELRGTMRDLRETMKDLRDFMKKDEAKTPK